MPDVLSLDDAIGTEIDGVYVVQPTCMVMSAGFSSRPTAGSGFRTHEMIQSNYSNKQAGALVGLHYHLHQADYWYVPIGITESSFTIFSRGGPTDGNTACFDISGENHWGVYIPPGVAHGFSAVTDVVMTYLVDGYYNPADELGVAWNDTEIGGDWVVTNPIVSERDQQIR